MATNEIMMLIITLAQQVVLMLAVAFVLFALRPVRRLGRSGANNEAPASKLFLALIFGLFGIMGNYSADPVFHSYANLRAMSVITGGLLGGPVVGLGAGFIAGGYRFLIDIGGFSATPCALATILEGAAAGWLHLMLKGRAMDWRTGAGLAFVGESLHMALVLALARPYAEAAALVQVIALPMIALNSVGAGLFIHIISLHNRFHELRDSNAAQKILSIANRTSAHLRFGLNFETTRETADIILSEVDVSAVALTDCATVLAHAGVGADHHFAGQSLVTKATRNSVRSGKAAFIHSEKEIGCSNANCPFKEAVIVPLHKQGNVVGTLKFYGTQAQPLSQITFELAKGLANLFSTQLELEEIEGRDRLLAQAEIGRLQAQINPHFLFNALNAIGSLCRTEPLKARGLILDLAQYMRKNLDNSRDLIPLADELEQVNAYLAIEKARFGERIRFEAEVGEEAKLWPAPPLMIQPLVENAIRHGLAGKEEGGVVRLTAQVENEMLVVDVADDGVGMSLEQIQAALPALPSTRNGWRTDKIGLSNCHQRLLRNYGPEYGLSIESEPGAGTRVTMRIPLPAKSRAAAQDALGTQAVFAD
jgi:two-component system, LytTR family, sensor histidine kinase LytS